jgi:hypothetical protein
MTLMAVDIEGAAVQGVLHVDSLFGYPSNYSIGLSV